VAGVYDKIFPYWSEFDGKNPVRPAQKDAVVVETDFGRLGLAICFDAKFPEVFQRLREKGADLVVWSSAYSGYTELQAFSLLHHYYIVTSTWTGDCVVYDITGRNLLDKNDQTGMTVVRFELDLDRQIYHYNFNYAKREKLLAEHKEEVRVENDMPREEWFVLKAVKPGISARDLANQYDIETLREYKDRSRRDINKCRGFDFYQKYGGYEKKH
jgi:hypothetical protein